MKSLLFTALTFAALGSQAATLTCTNQKYEIQMDIEKTEGLISAIRFHNEAKEHIVISEKEIIPTEDSNYIRLYSDRRGAPSLTYKPTEKTVMLSHGNGTGKLSMILKNDSITESQLIFENCSEATSDTKLDNVVADEYSG